MGVLGKSIWSKLLPVLGFAGFIALIVYASSDCGLDADGTKCTAGEENITKIRANEYYCKLVAYRDACGSFPTTEQGLIALAKPPTTPPLCPRYPDVPLVRLTEPPKDGWGEVFVYESDGSGFRILSSGRQRWYQQNGWDGNSRAVDAGYPRAGINPCFESLRPVHVDVFGFDVFVLPGR